MDAFRDAPSSEPASARRQPGRPRASPISPLPRKAEEITRATASYRADWCEVKTEVRA
jgi:hypothetical protein